GRQPSPDSLVCELRLPHRRRRRSGPLQTAVGAAVVPASSATAVVVVVPASSATAVVVVVPASSAAAAVVDSNHAGSRYSLICWKVFCRDLKLL
ncbi:unnamed protein product, partial [Urochloa humidicola]